MTLLQLSDVGVAVGSASLLHEVAFSVDPGSWVGIIGPNGAGKTTILRAIAGLMPSTGEIRLSGELATGISLRRRAQAMSLVPQRPEIPVGMRVIDYVVLGRSPYLRFFEMGGEADAVAAGEALRTLGVGALGDRRLASLSGGELQRVVLARALTQRAPLMLLDEPTAALDVGQAQAVMSAIDVMRRSGGLTIVSAIHDLTLAAQFCDRLVLVAGGRVTAMGEPRSVLTESSIRDHYGARVRVLHEENGAVVVIPLRDAPADPPPASMEGQSP